MSAAAAEAAARAEANTPVASRFLPTREKVSRSSMATLAQGQWLNDEIVNFVGRILIAKSRSTSSSRAHVYSSHFMNRLLSGGPRREDYNFQEVRNYDNRIENGLASLDELYIPINVNNAHWIFTQVNFRRKTVFLFDSMGKQQSNNHYIEETMRYVYDALFKDSPNDRSSFTDWSQDWTGSDESGRSPLQDNGYDCGIFMLISMGLLRNGHTLSRDSYKQSTLRLRHARRKLAWTIWKTGLGDDEIRWQPRTRTRLVEAPVGQRPHRRGVTQGHKRKRGRPEGRLTTSGGPRIQAFFRPPKRRKEDQGRGCKRTAQSEAEEEGERGLMRRYLETPRKRARAGLPGH